MEYQKSKIKDQNYSSKLKTISRYVSLVLCIVTLYLALSILRLGKVYAEGIGLSVSPSLMKVEITSPADTKSPIILENSTNNSVSIRVFFKPFRASAKENGEVVHIKDNEIPDKYNKIFNRIHLTDNGVVTNNFELGPKQKKNLELQFTVPKSEPGSDYYFSIIFSASAIQQPDNAATEQSTSLRDQNFSGINVGIATNVLLSINNHDYPQGAIEEFSTPGFTNSGPVDFTVRIKNIGSRVLTPKAIIFIKNMFGQTVGRIDIEPENILAGSVRSLTDTQTASSSTQLSTQKIFWRENFLLGPYTATLNIAVSEKGPVYSRSIIFLALPFQIILTVTLGILIITAISLRVTYHLKNDK